MTPDQLKAQALNDPRRLAQMQRWLGLRAQHARTGFVPFFEFVMREQVSRRPIKVMPHQRVLLDFIEAHDRSCNIIPIGTGKTFTSAGITLRLMGEDPTLRGAIVSAAQSQSEKTVGVVSDYILHSPELRLVYPHLRPSQRKRDPWTQTSITVDRPPGIADPSLVAVGFEGNIAGDRLNWIVIDDILNHENTYTPEQRKKVLEWLDSTVLRRLDPKGAKVIVINTPWHPDDLVHKLEKAGWATLRMDIAGGIKVQDDEGTAATNRALGIPWKAWEHPELRPASKSPAEESYRLRSHDPDPTNEVPLWPERYPAEWIAKIRAETIRTSGVGEFNRAYMGLCRDDDTAMCKVEWIEACKKNAQRIGHFRFEREYKGPDLVVCGVDLAFRKGQTADKTCLFTAQCLPTGHRKVLEIQLGQWDAPEILKRILDVHRRYNAVFRVEDNAAQIAMNQMLRAIDASLPVKSHTTGQNKSNHQYGVQGVFIDMENEAWVIPCDSDGNVHPATAEWLSNCLYYNPNQHTGDALMASWLAREQARAWGAIRPASATMSGDSANIGMSIMSR